MRKIFAILLSILGILSLMGCKTTKKKATILIPNGTPSIALTYIDFEKYDVTYVSGADVIASAFISESYDFIVAPIQLGAKLYNLNQNYSLVSVLVNCNYYLVSKNEITIENIVSKSITIFGENTMPDIISKYVFSKNSLNNLNITYVSSAQDSATALVTSATDVVLLSEPQIASLESKLGSLYTLDLSSLFLEDETIDFIPQAALFAKSGVDSALINSIKEEAKSSIDSVNKNPSSAAAYAQTISVDGYNKINESVFASSISRSALNYTNALDAKDDVLAFFAILNSYNSNLLGGEVNDEFFD